MSDSADGGDTDGGDTDGGDAGGDGAGGDGADGDIVCVVLVDRRQRTTVKRHAPVHWGMSDTERQQTPQCISCGIQVSGMNAAQFACPDCGTTIYRCAKCRKQSNLYECRQCGFRGP